MRGLLNDNIARFEANNYYGFPEIFEIPDKINVSNWLDFDTARRNKGNGAKRPADNGTSGVHFFISDYKFNSVWEYPSRYIEMFKRFDFIVSPDFSLYYDFPVSLQIFNKFRNHWLSAYYSVYDVTVIPNVSVSLPDCWDWSFLGYPKNSVLAFSDIGSMSSKSERDIVYSAYNEMIKRLEPIQIIYFTRSDLKYAPKECNVVQLPYIKGV